MTMYVVTTKKLLPVPVGPGQLGGERVEEVQSCLAVDGLDEAYKATVDITWPQFADAMNMGHAGATIGPLCDGCTVVEVEPVELNDLAARGRWVGDFKDPAAIIANYNEMQEQT